MATAYAAPEGFAPPEINFPEDYRVPEGGTLDDAPWMKKETEYMERLAAEAKRVAAVEGKPSDLVGEVLRWGRGDGYAQYMVWRQQPLQLIHLETGDAWAVEEALIRGLRVGDVRRMVESERRLQELFERKT